MNRLLVVIRKSIPYSPEIKRMVGSTNASILMQQLDYYFESKPDGFYKFIEPSGHPLYRSGDSWTEDLGFTLKEFLTAFEKIGLRYKSKSEFQAAKDKFDGRFYCCFVDRRSGNLTWYFRNHELVDKALDDLLAAQTTGNEFKARNMVPPASPTEVMRGNQRLRTTSRRSVPRTSQTAVPGVDQEDDQCTSNHAVHRYTQKSDQYTYTTTKNSEIPTTKQSEIHNSTAMVGLIFPQISSDQRKAIESVVAKLAYPLQQNILDEIEGKRRKGKLGDPVAISKYFADNPAKFKLSSGIQVRNERIQREEHASRQSHRVIQEAAFGSERERALVEMDEREFAEHCKPLTQGIKDRLSKLRVDLKLKKATHE